MDGLPLTGTGSLAALTPLAAELATLKRLRDARSADSLASRLFRRAWAALLAGEDPGRVALATTADALAALRLGAMDAGVLSGFGLEPPVVAGMLARALEQVAAPLSPGLHARLRDRLGQPIPLAPDVPSFVEALVRQPRAGVTCPGRARIVLEPPEGHGDHCLVVAVLGVVLAEHYGASPATVFVAGLAHHFHNAGMPDSGFAGEILLGEHLEPVMARVRDAIVASLPSALAPAVREALRSIQAADTPEGRAFNAADVIDRVLEIRHFAEVASFTTERALGEMELVHAGPLQAFHAVVLHEAGLAEAAAGPPAAPDA